MYTVGIKLFMHLAQGSGASTDSANVAVFFVCLLTTIGVGEAFHRLVDYPADAFARFFFDWLRDANEKEAETTTATTEKK